ncbi:MAG: ATP phosphoribosyltransferase regulatory subunit, partial [Deltaproteobacteria bacterium]|nr:ATP phosphoribosyltransferase regulatory subunit [Deltaproteobacteria bacterium]
PDCRRRLTTNPLRVIDCKVPRCMELVQDAPSILDTLCPDCSNHFDIVKKGLDTSSVPYLINSRLVRGLDYYMRTTFEAVAGNLGAQNAVAGGGRYDGLFKTIGGPDVPGIGFAIGLERLVMLLPPEIIRPEGRLDLYVAALNEAAI